MQATSRSSLSALVSDFVAFGSREAGTLTYSHMGI